MNFQRLCLMHFTFGSEIKFHFKFFSFTSSYNFTLNWKIKCIETFSWWINWRNAKFSPYHYFKKLQKLSYYLVFYVYKISVPMIVVLKSTARRQKISGFVSAGGLEFKINFACWNREFNPFYIFFIFSMQCHLYIAILLLYCLCFCIMYNVLHMNCLSKYVSYGIQKYFNIIPITSV